MQSAEEHGGREERFAVASLSRSIEGAWMASPLVVENVSKRFRQGQGWVTALRGVSIEVQRGQFLAIMGASGSGKSTLLHLMAGLTRADGGRVLVDGQDLFNLIPTLTAEENIALPLMLDGKHHGAGRRKVEEMLDTLGLTPRRSHRPDALSGGEQQRVAIGRALVTEPSVILADEPTGNLDSANSRSVCELLRDLCAVHGKTIVLVTHEPAVAAYTQEVAIIKDGTLVERFSTDETGGGQGLALRYQESLR
jgi:putative ABC transport system ATP-binding protein